MTDKNELQVIKQLLDTAENNIRQARGMLFTSEVGEKARNLKVNSDGDIVEGVFDGENMIGPDKKVYQVPVNYASKSKLIPGDILKLTIAGDGSFVFKQIGPIKRKKVVGELEELSAGKYVCNVDSKKYRVLTASVTYFKAEVGNKLVIVIPYEGESEWAAIENLLENKEI